MHHNKSKTDLVLDALDKHFDSVFVRTTGSITKFHCRLSENCWWTFPFRTEDVNKSQPYDIVNSIWDYIIKKF